MISPSERGAPSSTSWVCALSLAALIIPGCTTTSRPELTVVAAMSEPFPGVRVDAVASIVEFDAKVSPLLHSPTEPLFYIEQAVSTPNTKAHEALLITDARAEHIHAALLLAGFEPGTPGRWSVTESGAVQRTEPNGDPLSVSFLLDDGNAVSPHEWIVHLDSGERHPEMQWVFAGSEFKQVGEREIYLASDEAGGTVIGFTTFGTETIAPVHVMSHASEVDEPVWIADVTRVPPNGTPVVVRLTAPR